MSYTAKSEDDDVAQIFLEKLEKDLRDIWRIVDVFSMWKLFSKSYQKRHDVLN